MTRTGAATSEDGGTVADQTHPQPQSDAHTQSQTHASSSGTHEEKQLQKQNQHEQPNAADEKQPSQTDTSSGAPTPFSPPRKQPPRRAAEQAQAVITAQASGYTTVVGSTSSSPSKILKGGMHMTEDDDDDMPTPSPPVRTGSTPDEAASRIQALVRGARVRHAQRHALLRAAWAELDWAEESRLLRTHRDYRSLAEKLKAAVEEKRKSEVEGGKQAMAAEAAGAQRSATRKQQQQQQARRSSLSSADEEAAVGLALRPSDPITLTWLQTLMEHVRLSKPLPTSTVLSVISRAKALFSTLPNIVSVSCPARLTVVGDLHGQLDDLLSIFTNNGLPSPRNRYLFNGDVVDRGRSSMECMTLLLAWHVHAPDCVMINRGNHEARDLNERDGFERECWQKTRGRKVFDAFSNCFAHMPFAHIIEKQVFVVHGGLFKSTPSIADLQKEKRVHEVPPTGSHLEYALWSDPDKKKGRRPSPRGAGIMFGADVTQAFLEKNSLSLIVRSHECVDKGYEMHHNDRVITVFSASNYCGTVGNDGALVVFERDGETSLTAGNSSSNTARPASPQPHASPSLRPASPRPKEKEKAVKDEDEKQKSSQKGKQQHKQITMLVPPPPRSSRSATGKGGPQELQVPGTSTTPTLTPLRLSFITYYAGKKERQAGYSSMRSGLQAEVINKLFHLISEHRLRLIDYWSPVSARHSSGVAAISRAQWSAGLKQCLGLNLPFLRPEFQALLGLPKLGVDGKEKGPIDFMAFLSRFRPVNLVILRAQKKKEERAKGAGKAKSADGSKSKQGDDGTFNTAMSCPMNTDTCHAASSSSSSTSSASSSTSSQSSSASPASCDAYSSAIHEIAMCLHRQRFELESLFRFLDSDGDEQISGDEFREGLLSLRAQMELPISNNQIDDLLHHLDEDGNGLISYGEFFRAFRLGEPSLNTDHDTPPNPSDTTRRPPSHTRSSKPSRAHALPSGDGDGDAADETMMMVETDDVEGGDGMPQRPKRKGKRKADAQIDEKEKDKKADLEQDMLHETSDAGTEQSSHSTSHSSDSASLRDESAASASQSDAATSNPPPSKKRRAT